MKTDRRVIAAALPLLAPVLALAQQAPPPATPPTWWYWAPPMWHGGWGWWWIFPLFMFVFMIGCMVAAVRAFRSGAGFGPCGHGHAHQQGCADAGRPGSSALRILDERFARGELQKNEYEEKRAALERQAPPRPA